MAAGSSSIASLIPGSHRPKLSQSRVYESIVPQREGRVRDDKDRREVPQYNAFTQLKEISHSLTQERVMKVIALRVEINSCVFYCFPYLVYIIITCVVCFISTKCLIS